MHGCAVEKSYGVFYNFDKSIGNKNVFRPVKINCVLHINAFTKLVFILHNYDTAG